MSRREASAVDASSEKSSPPNSVYSSDIRETLKHSKWILRSLGLWPMIAKNTSATERYASKILIIFSVLAVAFPMVPATLHAILKEVNPLVRVLRLGPCLSCLSSIAKYIFIIIRRERIKRCVEHMENDWMTVESPNEREIMTRNARVGRGLTMTACVFTYTGGMFYNAVMPLLKGTRVNERNETIRPLTYPGFDMFVDVQRSPNYEIIFGGCCVAAFVRYTIIVATCNLAAVFVSHACGQIQIVMARLGGLFDDVDEKRNDEILRQRIADAIHCHVRGLSLSTRIDDTLREICLIEVVNATVIICLLEYYCMMEWGNSEAVAMLTYLLLLISFIFNIFIFCHIGELLKEQCQEVGNAAYMINWYRLPGKTVLALVMVIAMAEYPRRLTAGGMMEMSIISFGNIMKTSVGYLNMLRTVAG